MCKFKVGDRVKAIKGFSVGALGTIVEKPKDCRNNMWSLWVLRDHSEYAAGYEENELQLIERKEETMFEVGKKYIFIGMGIIKECVFVNEHGAVLKGGGGSEFLIHGVSKYWKEYKEPKVYTIDKFVSIDKYGDIYVSTVKMSDYDVDNVGKIKVTYIEGSGLTVDVLK